MIYLQTRNQASDFPLYLDPFLCSPPRPLQAILLLYIYVLDCFHFIKICGISLLFQAVNPFCNVLEHFGRDGFLYLAVLGGETCGAVLEEVV